MNIQYLKMGKVQNTGTFPACSWMLRTNSFKHFEIFNYIQFREGGVLTAQNPPIFTARTKVRGGHREEANVGLLLTQTPKKNCFCRFHCFSCKNVMNCLVSFDIKTRQSQKTHFLIFVVRTKAEIKNDNKKSLQPGCCQ